MILEQYGEPNLMSLESNLVQLQPDDHEPIPADQSERLEFINFRRERPARGPARGSPQGPGGLGGGSPPWFTP